MVLYSPKRKYRKQTGIVENTKLVQNHVLKSGYQKKQNIGGKKSGFCRKKN